MLMLTCVRMSGNSRMLFRNARQDHTAQTGHSCQDEGIKHTYQCTVLK